MSTTGGQSASQDLRLGTRGSQLALWQANEVATRVAGSGGPPCRIVTIKTSGDQLQEAPLSEAGGKRLFVKEIEDALLRGDIDLAVHSSKDMPSDLPPGLTIAAVLERADPLDAVVLPFGASGTIDRIDALVALLGQTPTFGTGSVRRIAQLRRLFPHARFRPIRGNLDTRLRKLDEGGYDALVLATAGLVRLGFQSRISFRLPASTCLPAPGQGIVAVEIREGDERARRAVAPINDVDADAALRAERGVVEALGGGCQTPIGALVSPGFPSGIALVAVVVAPDGSRAISGTAHGTREDAASIGARVGAQLLADGAGEILEEARRLPGHVERIQP